MADEEIDPLDAFMADIQAEIKKNETQTPRPDDRKGKSIRTDIEEADKSTDFVETVAVTRTIGKSYADSQFQADEDVYRAAKLAEEEAEDQGGDWDDADEQNALNDARKKRVIAPLTKVDHSTRTYLPFRKSFYKPVRRITQWDAAVVDALREGWSMQVIGRNPVAPIEQFQDLYDTIDNRLISVIERQHFDSPTPIQCQCIPSLLSGRDVLGLSATGSGKTLTYLLPLIVHVMDQPELKNGEGPLALILAPTRELVHQIYTECVKYSKPYGMTVWSLTGGLSSFDQCRKARCDSRGRAGGEVLVATPGRLLDAVEKGLIRLEFVTYLVLDEADQMLNLGFEAQVRSAIEQCRPDRQMCMFSATIPPRIERLAREFLDDPLRIRCGDSLGRNAANDNISQRVEILINDEMKWPWLRSVLHNLVSVGVVLIFATKKESCEKLFVQISNDLFRDKRSKIDFLHGDKTQPERDDVVRKLRKGDLEVLVATDVAARGLDIPIVRTVINYDIPKDIQSHIHRIGRTGRAGDTDGMAISLLTKSESRYAVDLVNHLEQSGQVVSSALSDLAMQNPQFRKDRNRGGIGKLATTIGMNAKAAGIGFHEEVTSSSKPQIIPGMSRGLRFVRESSTGGGDSPASTEPVNQTHNRPPTFAAPPQSNESSASGSTAPASADGPPAKKSYFIIPPKTAPHPPAASSFVTPPVRPPNSGFMVAAPPQTIPPPPSSSFPPPSTAPTGSSPFPAAPNAFHRAPVPTSVPPPIPSPPPVTANYSVPNFVHPSRMVNISPAQSTPAPPVAVPIVQSRWGPPVSLSTTTAASTTTTTATTTTTTTTSVELQKPSKRRWDQM